MCALGVGCCARPVCLLPCVSGDPISVGSHNLNMSEPVLKKRRIIKPRHRSMEFKVFAPQFSHFELLGEMRPRYLHYGVNPESGTLCGYMTFAGAHSIRSLEMKLPSSKFWPARYTARQSLERMVSYQGLETRGVIPVGERQLGGIIGRYCVPKERADMCSSPTVLGDDGDANLDCV